MRNRVNVTSQASSGPQVSNLTLQNIQSDQFGSYECHVVNAMGHSTFDVELRKPGMFQKEVNFLEDIYFLKIMTLLTSKKSTSMQNYSPVWHELPARYKCFSHLELSSQTLTKHSLKTFMLCFNICKHLWKLSKHMKNAWVLVGLWCSLLLFWPIHLFSGKLQIKTFNSQFTLQENQTLHRLAPPLKSRLMKSNCLVSMDIMVARLFGTQHRVTVEV